MLDLVKKVTMLTKTSYHGMTKRRYVEVNGTFPEANGHLIVTKVVDGVEQECVLIWEEKQGRVRFGDAGGGGHRATRAD